MPLSLFVAILLVPGLVMGVLGSAVLTFVVQPGRTWTAITVRAVLGFGFPLAVFWGLAAVLPKNEATLGYTLAGRTFALPAAHTSSVRSFAEIPGIVGSSPGTQFDRHKEESPPNKEELELGL
jgi:hypothetical protein